MAKLKIIKNSDEAIYNQVTEDVKACNGQCPCFYPMDKDDKDFRCVCKNFREQQEPGPCHCGRYVKVLVED